MNQLLKLMNTMSNSYSKHGTKYLIDLPTCPTFLEFRDAFKHLKLDDFNMKYDKDFLYNPNEPLKYMKVINEEHCGMGIFFFPPGKGFPIHDHPGMMVGTKILDGILESHSYNVLDVDRQAYLQKIISEERDKEPANAKDLDRGLEAKDEGPARLKTGEISDLTPNCRNVHSVKAVENCAMLDVFIPNLSYRTFYTIIEEGKKEKNKDNIVKLRMKAKGTTFDLTQLQYEDFKK